MKRSLFPREDATPLNAKPSSQVQMPTLHTFTGVNIAATLALYVNFMHNHYPQVLVMFLGKNRPYPRMFSKKCHGEKHFIFWTGNTNIDREPHGTYSEEGKRLVRPRPVALGPPDTSLPCFLYTCLERSCSCWANTLGCLLFLLRALLPMQWRVWRQPVFIFWVNLSVFKQSLDMHIWSFWNASYEWNL